MKPSWYWGPAAGKSGFGPLVFGVYVGSALAGLLAPVLPLGGAVGAAGTPAVHAASRGNAAPPAAVTMSLRRLNVRSLLAIE